MQCGRQQVNQYTIIHMDINIDGTMHYIIFMGV